MGDVRVEVSDTTKCALYQISQVGWPWSESAKHTRDGYNTPYITTRNQWTALNREQSQHQKLAKSLALDELNTNSGLPKNQRLANNLALEEPAFYKRTMIAKSKKNS